MIDVRPEDWFEALWVQIGPEKNWTKTCPGLRKRRKAEAKMWFMEGCKFQNEKVAKD